MAYFESVKKQMGAVTATNIQEIGLSDITSIESVTGVDDVAVKPSISPGSVPKEPMVQFTSVIGKLPQKDPEVISLMDSDDEVEPAAIIILTDDDSDIEEVFSYTKPKAIGISQEPTSKLPYRARQEPPIQNNFWADSDFTFEVNPGEIDIDNFLSSSDPADWKKSSQGINESGDMCEPDLEEELEAAAFSEKDGANVILVQPPKSLHCTLFPHQHVGMSWLYAHELENYGGLLADDQGLGKTIQMIALMLKNSPENYYKLKSETNPTLKDSHYRSLPHKTLIVVPVVTINQWYNEIDKFSNSELNVLMFYKKDKVKEIDRNVDVVLSTYGTVNSEVNKSINPHKYYSPLCKEQWFRVILDESHTVKNPKTQGHKSVGSMNSVFKWCLTGTPIFNNLMELYAQLSICSLNNLPDSKTFRGEIDAPIRKTSKQVAGIKDPIRKKQLMNKVTQSDSFLKLRTIVNDHVLRRTKVTRNMCGNPLIPLPQKVTYIRQIPFSEREMGQYKSLEAGAKARLNVVLSLIKRKIDIPAASTMHIVVVLLRLRQFCDHPLIALTAMMSGEEFLDSLISSLGDSDIDVVLEFLPVNLRKAIKNRLADRHKTMEAMSVVTDEEERFDGKVDMKSCLLAILSGNLAPDNKMINSLKSKDAEGRLQLSDIPFWASSKMIALIDDLFEVRRKHQDASQTSRFNSSKATWENMKSTLPANQAPSSTFSPPEYTNYSYDNMKVLIFSQFTKFLDVLEATLIKLGFKSVRLDGSMSQELRQVSIHKFEADPTVEIFLISLKAGGIGLNLVTASHIFLMDMWWNGCLEDQAIDRVHRITQQKQVTVVRYCMAESVEMKILGLQEEKRTISKGTFSEQFEETKVFSLKEICKLFGVSYGGKKSVVRYGKNGIKRTKVDKIEQEPDLEQELAEWDKVVDLLSEQLVECANGKLKEVSQRLVSKVPSLKDLAHSLIQKKPDLKLFPQLLSQKRHDSNVVKSSMKWLFKQNYSAEEMFSLMDGPETVIVSAYRHKPDNVTVEAFMEKISTRKLVSLTIQNVYNLQENFFVAIVRHHPRLIELNLPNNGSGVTNKVLDAISSTLMNTLEALNIKCAYNCSNIDALMKLKNLKSLMVSECSEAKLDAEDLATLSWESRDCLEYIDLSYCSNLEKQLFGGEGNTLFQLFSEYKKLKHVSLKGLPENLMPALVLNKLSDLFLLETLDLSECPSIFNNLDFVERLSSKFPNLKDLSIADIVSKEVDLEKKSKFARKLDALGKLVRLERLNLSLNVFLDDESLFRICQGCSVLKILNINKCVSITSDGFRKSLKHLKRIEKLKVSWCKNFSDQIVEDVFFNEANKFPFLVELGLSGCEITWSIAKSLRTKLRENSRTLCNIVV